MSFQVLLITDTATNASLIQELVRAKGTNQFELERADRLSTGLQRLAAGGVDLLLVDLILPDSQGLETFVSIQAQIPQTPTVVLCDPGHEGLAVEAVQRGAQDYLLKRQIVAEKGAPLLRVIRYAIERAQMQDELRQCRVQLETLMQAHSDEIAERKRTESLLQVRNRELALLNLPFPDNDLTRSLDSKLRKTSLETLLVDCLRDHARQTPLLLVLEDCHWLDALSHDLLDVIGKSISDLPVLLLAVYRPPTSPRSKAPRVSELEHFTAIQLGDFTTEEARQLIALKVSQLYNSETAMLVGLVEQITARTEGNPFYIDELLNYLHDRDIDPLDSQALAQFDLPNSLYSLILSRIERLSEDQKRVLKVASVIGRLFRASWLWQVYPQLGQPRHIKADLAVLCNMELTTLDRPEPELTYMFKHIVTQEVAYESLAFAVQSMLHEHVGQFIERRYSETLEQYVDLLALHYERSKNEDKKRKYLLQAGDAAQANYANEAAIDYYQRALPLLPDEQQMEAQLNLGQVLERVGQWDEAHKVYQHTLDLVEQLDDQLGQARCQTVLGDLYRKQGQYEQALTWLQRAQSGFEELGDRAGVGQALHYMGTLAAYQGDYETARGLYRESLEIRRALDDKPQIASLLSNLGIIARFQDDDVLARALYEEALAIRRELKNKWAIAISLNNLGNVELAEGNHAQARQRLEEAIALQKQVGDKWSIANSLNNLGNVVRTQGDYEAARELYNESLLTNWELGDKRALAYLFEDMGSLAALQGSHQRALCLVGVASALREDIGSPLSPSEQSAIEKALATAQQELDQAAQAAAMEAGKAMSLDEAVEYALADDFGA